MPLVKPLDKVHKAFTKICAPEAQVAKASPKESLPVPPNPGPKIWSNPQLLRDTLQNVIIGKDFLSPASKAFASRRTHGRIKGRKAKMVDKIMLFFVQANCEKALPQITKTV